MEDSGNEINDGGDCHVPRLLEQSEIDEINMRDLSAANRLFRKCISGKCPPLVEKVKNINMPREKPRTRTKKPNFTSNKLQDKRLIKIWVTTGRGHRYKALENDLRELNIKIKVATSQIHLRDHETNFKAIKRTISKIETMDEQIKKAELEVSHLKSQFGRLSQKKDELSLETESEGKERESQDSIRSAEIFLFHR